MEKVEILIIKDEIMIILKKYQIDEIKDIKKIKSTLILYFLNENIKINLSKIILKVERIYITDMKSFLINKENADSIIIDNFENKNS